MKRDIDRRVARLVDVGKVYRIGEREVTALKDVALDIERGEFLIVRGRSGSGKSALLRILAALERPDSGRALIFGRDLRGLELFEIADMRNRRIGYIPQDNDLIGDMSIIENIAVPLRTRDMAESKLRRIAYVMLEGFGLGKRADDQANRLSSSEQSFVMLARALINGPELIVADDPTGRINETAGARIIDTLNDARSEHEATIVVATADQRLLNIADRAVALDNGVVKKIIPRDEFRIRPPSIQ